VSRYGLNVTVNSQSGVRKSVGSNICQLSDETAWASSTQHLSMRSVDLTEFGSRFSPLNMNSEPIFDVIAASVTVKEFSRPSSKI
jgi:hypothetical protein